MAKEPLIWWTNQSDAETAAQADMSGFPKYLKAQFDSRYGRGGRGRLWRAERFGDFSVDPWPETELADELAGDYGGIVIRAKHRSVVAALPGIITDASLNRLDESSEQK